MRSPAVRRSLDLEWLAPAARAPAIRRAFYRVAHRAVAVRRARAPARAPPDADFPEGLRAAARWDFPASPVGFPEVQLALRASQIIFRPDGSSRFSQR